MASGARITVFGGVTIDRLATASGEIAVGASNPGRVVSRFGGVALNVATILAQLGHTVSLVSRVGDDDDGRRIIRRVAAAGIASDGIGVSKRSPTGSYTAIFDRDGDLVLGVADLAACEEMLPADAPELAAGLAHGGPVVIDANLPGAAVEHLARTAAGAGGKVAALAVSPAKAPRLRDGLEHINWLFANRAEAAAILGLDPDDAPTPANLAAQLIERTGGAAIVTDGGRRLAIAEGAEVHIRPPHPVTVLGVNGAGDSLAAGTIHRLSAGERLPAAIDGGIAAAALTLEHGGISEAMFSSDRLAGMVEVVRGSS